MTNETTSDTTGSWVPRASPEFLSTEFRAETAMGKSSDKKTVSTKQRENDEEVEAASR
jgi:hypothetical protein